MLKISINLKTSRANNLRALENKKAKLSRHCFCMNTDILGNFEICINIFLMCALLRTTNFSYN